MFLGKLGISGNLHPQAIHHDSHDPLCAPGVSVATHSPLNLIMNGKPRGQVHLHSGTWLHPCLLAQDSPEVREAETRAEGGDTTRIRGRGGHLCSCWSLSRAFSSSCFSSCHFYSPSQTPPPCALPRSGEQHWAQEQPSRGESAS